ncbi:DUF421 domain-containing protein [Robertmurraya korlensis]|uniref:DUF421 domain-containing protein n=1 Tax=Robertmurraya korlensis TaxID=519977 RepID=UPI00255A081C|nr:DUF421 domain-containing protein [Robertmurraya korlensis]
MNVEILKDILLVYGRIFIIMPLLLMATLFMGKRSIGELPVFDFLVIITLGAIVGADIADPTIKQIPTAAAVIALAILQKIVTATVIKYRRIGKALTFEPTIVIKNGELIVSNLKKINYSIDNILQMLREKEVFDLSIVQLGIIEANGRLSLFKYAKEAPVVKKDLGLTEVDHQISLPVIIEGKIDTTTLEHLNKDETWLKEELSKKKIKLSDVFFASINENFVLHISLQNQEKPNYINH